MILKDSGVRRLTKNQAKLIIKEVVFNASVLLERLEAQGKLSADGYRLRKKLARHAAAMIENNWVIIKSEKKGDR